MIEKGSPVEVRNDFENLVRPGSRAFVVSVGYYREEIPEAAFPSYEAARAWIEESYPDFEPRDQGPEPTFFEGRFLGALISPVDWRPARLNPPKRDPKREAVVHPPVGVGCSTVIFVTAGPIESLPPARIEPLEERLPFPVLV